MERERERVLFWGSSGLTCCCGERVERRKRRAVERAPPRPASSLLVRPSLPLLGESPCGTGLCRLFPKHPPPQKTLEDAATGLGETLALIIIIVVRGRRRRSRKSKEKDGGRDKTDEEEDGGGREGKKEPGKCLWVGKGVTIQDHGGFGDYRGRVRMIARRTQKGWHGQGREQALLGRGHRMREVGLEGHKWGLSFRN